jgi:hypothetical protein
MWWIFRTDLISLSFEVGMLDLKKLFCLMMYFAGGVVGSWIDSILMIRPFIRL